MPDAGLVDRYLGLADFWRLARRLIGDATTPEEKTRRLYTWVARNIRYLGIYAGSGGYVPHSAASILKNRFGDCKDHVTLLEAMLRSVGIESTPALINADRAYLLPSTPVTGIFDHVISYVPALNLFLDSTARFTPVGTLPQGVVGKPALIVFTGEVKSTPIDTADSDSTNTVTQMVLHEDGRVTGSTKITQRGPYQWISVDQAPVHAAAHNNRPQCEMQNIRYDQQHN